MATKIQNEINRLVSILNEYNVPEKKQRVLMPVIENTAFMKVKLDETRKMVKKSGVAISYDNGGGQRGIRENPIFKGYESLWKSYMSGLNIILSTLPAEVAKEETDKAEEKRTVLELVLNKHMA